jgi:glycopeptide antibiotics resistance protein
MRGARQFIKASSEVGASPIVHLRRAKGTQQLTFRRRSSSLTLSIWVCVIVLVAVPWNNFGTHAHWERVVWIPFSKDTDLLDVIANGLFYFPYGVLVAAVGKTGRRHPVAFAVTTAAALSVITEFTQVFSASRIPAVSDVIANAVGALVGSWWTLRRNLINSR